MSVQIADNPTDTIREWVHEQNGSSLWREKIGLGSIDCYRVFDEEGMPKLFLVQRFQGGGIEVYTPATESLMTDDTLVALDEWLES